MGVVSWCNLSLVGVAWTQWVCLWPLCVWHGLGECDMGVGLRRGGLFAISGGDMYSLGAVWPQ